jgi:D-alanyl-D-alanine carboxypeptidase
MRPRTEPRSSLPVRASSTRTPGYVIAGILVEQATGRPLHEVYRELVFDPLGMDSTWLEGHEPARKPDAAHHYSGELDWTTIAPTIDWAGAGSSAPHPTSPASYARSGRNGSSTLAR